MLKIILKKPGTELQFALDYSIRVVNTGISVDYLNNSVNTAIVETEARKDIEKQQELTNLSNQKELQRLQDLANLSQQKDAEKELALADLSQAKEIEKQAEIADVIELKDIEKDLAVGVAKESERNVVNSEWASDLSIILGETVADYILRLEQIKASLKQQLTEKGVNILDETFYELTGKISSIESIIEGYSQAEVDQIVASAEAVKDQERVIAVEQAILETEERVTAEKDAERDFIVSDLMQQAEIDKDHAVELAEIQTTEFYENQLDVILGEITENGLMLADELVQLLRTNVQLKGIVLSGSESLRTVINKVLEIVTESGSTGFTQAEVDQFVADAVASTALQYETDIDGVLGEDVVDGIVRLEEVKSELASNIAEKGVTLDGSETFYGLAAKVNAIQSAVGYKIPWEDALALSGKDNGTNMFATKNTLTRIPLVDVSSVTGFSGFCNGCIALLELPVGYDFRAGTDYRSMFKGCNNLRTLNGALFGVSIYAADMFNGCYQLEDEIVIDMNNVVNISNMFYACKKVKRIIFKNMSKCSSIATAFYNCNAVEYIDVLDLTLCTTTASLQSAFYHCDMLVDIGTIINIQNNIRFDTCTSLTHDCLIKILNALVDRTATTAAYITLGAVNLAKLTAEEIAIGTNKKWVVE